MESKKEELIFFRSQKAEKRTEQKIYQKKAKKAREFIVCVFGILLVSNKSEIRWDSEGEIQCHEKEFQTRRIFMILSVTAMNLLISENQASYCTGISVDNSRFLCVCLLLSRSDSFRFVFN